jgi:2-amino-4-hydroxy-6-hydroxymethyldihydropteridine diphosphokinase
MSSAQDRAPVVAHVGLGGNLGDVEHTLALARKALNALPGVRLARISRVYRTEPQGFRDQPFFLNQVAALDCDPAVRPESLLDSLLALETACGRVRRKGERKDGPRALDLDLLLFGRERRSSPRLMLPHPCIRRRAFVLIPLAEIAPDLIFPDGGHIADALRELRCTVTGDGIFQDDAEEPRFPRV